MTIKLIALDMDGTLLSSKDQILPKTKEVLIEVQKKGITVVLASGRSYRKLLSYAKELQMDVYGGYLVEVNGMALYNVKSGERMIKSQMTPETAGELFDYFSQFKVEIIGNMDMGMYDYMPPEILEEKKAWRKEHQIREDIPWTAGAYSFIFDNRKGYPYVYYIHSKEEITNNINKVSVTYWPDYLKQVYQKAKEDLKGRFWVGMITDRWMEVMLPDVTKANGLKELGKLLSIPMEDMMAFGDGENDIEMLEHVGYGIAMGNAFDSVKKAAFAVCEDNDHEGIAKAITKYLNF